VTAPHDVRVQELAKHLCVSGLSALNAINGYDAAVSIARFVRAELAAGREEKDVSDQSDAARANRFFDIAITRGADIMDLREQVRTLAAERDAAVQKASAAIAKKGMAENAALRAQERADTAEARVREMEGQRIHWPICEKCHGTGFVTVASENVIQSIRCGECPAPRVVGIITYRPSGSTLTFTSDGNEPTHGKYELLLGKEVALPTTTEDGR